MTDTAPPRDPDAAYDALNALIERYVGNSDAQHELRCAAAAYGLASARKAIDDMAARLRGATNDV